VIVAADSASLCSAIMPGCGVASRVTLAEYALPAIGQRMCSDGWTDACRRMILPSPDHIEFSKPLNRSVTGSMTDIARCTEFYLVLSRYLVDATASAASTS
jgi:hypothetical protein